MARQQICHIVSFLLLGLAIGINGKHFPRSLARNRIIGGEEVTPYSLPWQARLSSGCGATILCSRFVMTAAHCVEEKILVEVGVHNIKEQEPSKTIHKVIQSHRHPKYKLLPIGATYDFAILELSKPINFRDEARALKLPNAKDNEEHKAFNQDTLFVPSGWGATSWGLENIDYPDVLQSVTIPWLPDEACQEAYGKYDGKIDESMVCAGTAEKGVCHGDSGGPLAWLDPTTKDIKLIGAVSWGYPDCVSPGVFAELTTVLDWIKQVTGDCNEKTCNDGNCMIWDKLHPDVKASFTNSTGHA